MAKKYGGNVVLVDMNGAQPLLTGQEGWQSVKFVENRKINRLSIRKVMHFIKKGFRALEVCYDNTNKKHNTLRNGGRQMQREGTIVKRNNIFNKTLIAIIVLLCVILCESIIPVNAAQKKNQGIIYYETNFNTKGNPKNYIPGATKIEVNSKSITFYGSFLKGKSDRVIRDKYHYVKYGKKTFKLTANTKYAFSDDAKKYNYVPKKVFLERFLRNGGNFKLEVKNGKIQCIRRCM